MTSSGCATLNRMVPLRRPDREMIDGARYRIGKHILRTRAEVDAFESEHREVTASQSFIGGKRIRGSDALERRLGQNWPMKDIAHRPKGLSPFAALGAVAVVMGASAVVAMRIRPIHCPHSPLVQASRQAGLHAVGGGIRRGLAGAGNQAGVWRLSGDAPVVQRTA